MHHSTRTLTKAIQESVSLLCLALLMAAMGACTDNELSERKALIEFIEKEALPANGKIAKTLTPEQHKAFGRYSAHWGIVTGYLADIQRVEEDMLMAHPAMWHVPHSLEEIILSNARIPHSQALFLESRDQYYVVFEKTQAAARALNQPSDLASAFTKAFTLIVVVRADALTRMHEEYVTFLFNTQRFIEFFENNRDRVTVQGDRVTALDAAIESEIDTRLKQFEESAQKLLEIQRACNAVIKQ